MSFLINPYRFGGASSSLLTDLVSWWSLDETSGTRYDAHGSNDLADNATVLYGTGKISNAADFEFSVNGEKLTNASPSGLGGGDRDYTIACWFNPESLLTFTGLMSVQAGQGSSVSDWMLITGATSTNLYFYTATSSTWYLVQNTTALSTATWYLAIAEYDSVNDTLRLSINNGTAAETTSVPASNTTGNGFIMGSYGGSTSYYDGLIDEAAFWARLLTTDEKTALYNSGSGIAYPG